MIIQIDDQYFNPLLITTMHQEGNNVRIRFPDSYLYFKNWKITDLATEINCCIEVFNNGKV